MIDVFTERLAARIEHPEPDTIEHSLGDAGEIIRIWALARGDVKRAGAVGPLSEPIEFPSVSEEDAVHLHVALMKFVQSHPRDPLICSAVHGLRYLATPELKPLLIGVLRDSIGHDANTLYQTMITLEAAGEDLFGNFLSTSYDEVEQNERRAQEYLARNAAADR